MTYIGKDRKTNDTVTNTNSSSEWSENGLTGDPPITYPTKGNRHQG